MNLLTNATFLEGALAWQGTNLAVDETVLGGPGRAVLKGTGGFINSNYANGPDVVAGDLLEVMVLAKSGSAVVLQIEGGAEYPISLKRAGEGTTERGIPHTMSEYRSRVLVNADGKARIRVTNAVNAHISKPYIEKVGPNARTRFWTPGPHTNVDLNLPVWPSHFPPFQQDSVQINPTQVRKAFTGDVPIPSTSRMSLTPAYNFRGDLELSSLEYDQLEELCYGTGNDPFWFVRPDTKQLCHAYWTEDGQPTTNGVQTLTRRVGVGLLLQVV